MSPTTAVTPRKSPATQRRSAPTTASADKLKSTASTRPSAKKKATPAKTRAAKTPTVKQVAIESRRKASSVLHLTRDASFKLIDTQRAIWLAGLGALAKVTSSAGLKGEKAFEALVKAGEKLEAQARGTIDHNAELLKHRIDDATQVMDVGIDTVGDAFDARVKQALARLGYPKGNGAASSGPQAAAPQAARSRKKNARTSRASSDQTAV